MTFKPFAKACYKIGIAESAIQSFPKTSRKSLSIGKALFSHSASTIGGYVLNIHFVIELGQNRFNSIFNSTLNPEYSLKKFSFANTEYSFNFFRSEIFIKKVFIFLYKKRLYRPWLAVPVSVHCKRDYKYRIAINCDVHF